MSRSILVSIGVLLFVIGAAVSYAEWASGTQPWGQLLVDNFLFARSLPFTIGLGIVFGVWRATGWRSGTQRRASDGALRRFAPSTVLLHTLVGVATSALLATGGWQYLKGLLGVESPIYMGTVYRIHYLAASVLIFVVSVVSTDWWLRGERSLTIPRGQMIRNLRGLAHELPRSVGASLGYLMGLDMRRASPPTDQFTFYERAISFPTWTIVTGLIVVTGVIKAMRYIFPIPGDVLYWTSAIHVGSGVLLGMKLLDHLRYVLAPSRWPLMVSMATGWVPERFAQRFHPAWHARISTASSPAPAAAPSPAATPVVGPAGGSAL